MLVTRMEAWMERWKEETKEQILRESEKRGEQRGRARLVLLQLERRFGVLPVSVRDRVLAADTVTIEEWGLRLLEAASLEDVLA